MQHWKQNLDLPIHTVVYEDMVEHNEDVSEQLRKFVGLPAVTAARERPAQVPVITSASMWQARQPVFCLARRSSAGAATRRFMLGAAVFPMKAAWTRESSRALKTLRRSGTRRVPSRIAGQADPIHRDSADCAIGSARAGKKNCPRSDDRRFPSLRRGTSVARRLLHLQDAICCGANHSPRLTHSEDLSHEHEFRKFNRRIGCRSCARAG
jgi:hypothetical protein